MLRLICLMTLFGLLSGPLRAIVVASGNPDSAPIAVAYSNRIVTGIGQTVDLSGVVNIGNCSGSLLSDGYSILTAGHCVTPFFGGPLPSSITVNFLGPDGIVEDTSNTYSIYPGWNGTSEQGDDLAVIRLTQAAPSFAARYSLYTGAFITSPILLAGYGMTGVGATGCCGFGTLRQGQNRYDTTGAAPALGWSANMLVGDFDNGTATNNALGPRDSDIPNEVDIAAGDSGGPSFYNGLLIGVHDLTACFEDPSNSDNCAVPPDGPAASTSLNSAFGQLFADTSVSAHASWIQSQEEVPEPASFSLVLLGLSVAGFLGDRASRRRS